MSVGMCWQKAGTRVHQALKPPPGLPEVPGWPSVLQKPSPLQWTSVHLQSPSPWPGHPQGLSLSQCSPPPPKSWRCRRGTKVAEMPSLLRAPRINAIMWAKKRLSFTASNRSSLPRKGFFVCF